MADDVVYVAVDLGAESGRIMAGTLRQGRVELAQVHRFANVPLRLPDGLHWNVLGLYRETLAGLRRAAGTYGDRIVGIGVDSWAVDYGLLDAGGRLLGIPYHYRDARTDGVPEEVARCVSPAEQYARTGIAQLSINTLYQLVAQGKTGDGTLERARALLMIPDLLHYWLSGQQAVEYTTATSSGALGVDGQWAADLLARLDLPTQMLLPPTPPGTVLGELRPVVRDETGLAAAQVILPAGHDTACAIAAVPAVPFHGTGHPRSGSGMPRASGSASHAYISSGTWSLLGLELDRPILAEAAREAGFTNEGGVRGTYCFLRNIMGLWLLQECRRSWSRRGQDWSYDELSARAAAEPSPGVLIDVDDPAFLHPGDMPGAIVRHLQRAGQKLVTRPEALVRAILEGLALAYRVGVEEAENLAGTRVETVHVVGGGSRNALLCQLTADACRRPVLAGPVEATAMGNVMVQAMATGQVRDLAEAHAIARHSAELTQYEPREAGDWGERAARLRAIRRFQAEAERGARVEI